MTHDVKSASLVKNDVVASLLKYPNVTTCGVGYKNGDPNGQLSVIVGVKKKLPSSSLRGRDTIPKIAVSTRASIITDVVETGDIVAQQIDPKQKHRPICPGISVGHVTITAGTIGLICRHKTTGKVVVLSNNHVLANSNDASIGDLIIQPGKYDGGTSEDVIGTLLEFVPINYVGGSLPPIDPGCQVLGAIAKVLNTLASLGGRKHRLQVFLPQVEVNEMDAAIATIDEAVGYTTEVPKIGTPTGLKTAEIGMPVRKFGRTTEWTSGTVQQLNATVQVNYGGGKLAQFENQIITNDMSDGGDSGSSVHDNDGNVVGLLFAGSDKVTIISHIEPIFERLNLELL